MRKTMKRIACALAFTFLASAMAPAAQTAYAAEPKEFTYCRQENWDEITLVNMKKGEKVDLRFKGVPDYTNYRLKWSSSNPSVAVVDSAGVITALADGVTTISLQVGDGTVYTSTGVTVVVGTEQAQKQTVKVGISRTNTPYYYSIGLDQKIDLNAYATTELSPKSYHYDWVSTNKAVATIDGDGVITPKSVGATVIMLTLTNLTNGKSLTAMPIAIQVGTTGTTLTTPTPEPTKAPWATPTPIPTAAPTATPVPSATPTPTPVVTPMPSDTYVPYTVLVDSDHGVTVKFSKQVSFEYDDVQLYQLIEVGTETIEIRTPLENVKLQNDGTEMVVAVSSFFNTSYKYKIKIGPADPGRVFSVNYGAPTRIAIEYSCLGKKNVAYAYDATIGVDVPVTLTYKLFSNTVDVTKSFTQSNQNAFVYFDMLSPSYSEDVRISGDTLYFDEKNIAATIKATCTWTDNNGITRDIYGTTLIRSQQTERYNIESMVQWTIIDANDTYTTINWDKPVHSVVADGSNYKIVALLVDSYGGYYATDYRGADASRDILCTEDPNGLFSYMGYSCEFKAATANTFALLKTGDLYPFVADSRAVGYLTLYNSSAWYNGSRDIGAFQMNLKAPSMLTSIKLEKVSVSLTTDAVPGFESRFCQEDVKIILMDQYGQELMGNADFEVTCSNTQINGSTSANNGPATIVQKDGYYYLHVDAEMIRALSDRVSSVSFMIKEITTNRTATLLVSLKSPSMANGSINIGAWNIGMAESKIVIGDGNLGEKNANTTVEVYQLSTNGMNVGLFFDGYRNADDTYTNIKIQDNKNLNLDGCVAGEIYVLVVGPDNKIVELGDSNKLGMYKDAYGNVCINVSAMENNSISMLKEGRYNVTVTRILKANGTNVRKEQKITSFEIVDNTKDVTVRYAKDTTSLYAGPNDLFAIRALICDAMTFNLGDSNWTTMTSDMITAVDYEIVSTNYVRIKSIEFAVPADGKTWVAGGVTYKKVINNVNKIIHMGN